MLERRMKSDAKDEYLREVVGEENVIIMRECEYKDLGLHDWKPFKPLSEQDILDKIVNDDIFGLIECDIHTPPHIKDKCKEMAPIFRNMDINFEDIGEFSQKYAEQFDIKKQTVRALAGTLHADKILIASPLLKFYLRLGLKVTKIHQIIEYTGKRVFKNFADFVSTRRREGDAASGADAQTKEMLANR